MTKSLWRVVFSALALLSVLAIAVACGDDNAAKTTPTTAGGAGTSAAVSPTSKATAAIDLAADQTIKLNLTGEPGTLDPSKASFSEELSVIEQLFRGPFKFDNNLKVVPDMATEVPTKANNGISADGLVYTFKLKPGLKWSDGKAVSSKDVAFAIRRSADPRSGGDYQSFYQELKGGPALAKLKPTDPGIDAAAQALGVETPDESTVKLTLAQPNAVFIYYLALWMTYPLREDLIKDKGDKWTEAGNLLSTGPFLLKEWQHKDHITLVPNPNYFGPKPTIQTIKLLMIADANQAFNAYKAGDLDQVAIPSALVPTTKADPQLNKDIVTLDLLQTFRLSLVNTKAPFDNKKVRQALAYAVDRKALVDVALKGVGKPAGSFIPPGLAGYDQNLEPNFNATKAKQLLSEAGFADGKGLPKLTFTYTNAGNNPPIATFLKEQWKQVLNVDVDLDPVDSKTFTDRFKAGQIQFAFVGWGADFPDPQNFLDPNLRTGAGNNKSLYSNKAFDALLDKAATETDRTKAADIYKEAQKMMQDDSPDIFLFYTQSNILRRSTVKDLTNTPMDHRILGDRSLETVKIAKK